MITIRVQGKSEPGRTCSCPGEVITIGRADESWHPTLDLSPDETVSRRHARLWEQNGNWFVEDLGSLHGVMLEGKAIAGPVVLAHGSRLQLGNTWLQIYLPSDPLETGRSKDPLQVQEQVDSTDIHFLSGQALETGWQQRLALLLDLPLQFGSQADLNELLNVIMARTVEITPGACRGILLLYAKSQDQFQLKASIPAGTPPFSETLARRCLHEARGFIWNSESGAAQGPCSDSILEHSILSGMYAPMLWQGQAVGVIGVDNPWEPNVFKREDLRFLLAIAHYAAMAVVNHQQYQELAFNARVLERLLTNFSPKVRKHLLDRARKGKLQPGGETAEVAILFLDIRGFTSACKGEPPENIMEFLHHYFSVLVDIIFQYDGTVDKFIGDSILAVFGSPEKDPMPCEKAVSAAWHMLQAAEQIQKQRAEAGKPACGIGIGLDCGLVVHGFIGGADRLEFTVIGEPVNHASRYCAAAAKGEILISQSLFEKVFSSVEVEPRSVSTKHEGMWQACRVTKLIKAGHAGAVT